MDPDSDPAAAGFDGDESTDSEAPRASDSEAPRASDSDASQPSDGDEATVLLLMDADRDRDLLAEALGERYRVRAETDPAALDAEFDCCLLDAGAYEAVGDALDARRERASPAFLPFVLLVGEDARAQPTDRAWERVDGVIELPVGRRALVTRVSNLVERRLTSLRLGRTVSELRLKERAMDEAPVGITIARAGEGRDNPMVYMNDEFESLTGYGEERLGEDCRFLQGPDTEDEARARIRKGIDAGRPVDVDVLNYRASDQKFWNRLQIEPLRDGDGTVTHFVGFQTDITDRKIRERRLEVMARVLNHNLRNKMNLIEGYADLLRDDPDEAARRDAVEVIAQTAADLTGIAGAVQTVDETVSAPVLETPIDIGEELRKVCDRVRSRYPNADVTLSLPDDGPIEVTAVGLAVAVAEAVENAVKHNDEATPTVRVRVERPAEGWVAVEVADDGPGIPDHETRVLSEGETSLTHADRLGIWLMYWVVAKAGGEFDVDTDGEGTTVRLEVPVNP